MTEAEWQVAGALIAHVVDEMADQPHCVLSCAVAQMVLERLGETAEPWPVVASIGNAAFMQWLEDGTPGGQEEQLRRGAWLVTNRPDLKGAFVQTVVPYAPWPGHLVLKVNGFVVDPNLGQFNRPSHQIHLPPCGLFPPAGLQGTGGVFVDEDGTRSYVAYSTLETDDAPRYRTSKDWVERGRYTHAVEAIVEMIGQMGRVMMARA